MTSLSLSATKMWCICNQDLVVTGWKDEKTKSFRIFRDGWKYFVSFWDTKYDRFLQFENSPFSSILYVHCLPISYRQTRKLRWKLATKPWKTPGIAVVLGWRCTINDLSVVDGNVMKMVVVVSAEETCYSLSRRSVNKQINWNSSGLLSMAGYIEMDWFHQSDCSFSSTGTTITQSTPNHNSVNILTRLVGWGWLGVIETFISCSDW